MNKTALELLHRGLKKLEVPHDTACIEKIERYVAELLLFNSRFDLVNADTDEQLVVRHILDSLAGYPLFAETSAERIADIGSGAGFPGIPLAVFLPHVSFTLIERSDRRAGFLQNVAATLPLNNITVCSEDATRVQKTFDAVTARALTALDAAVFRMLFRLTAETGMLVLYKGNREKTAAELKSLQTELARAGATASITPVQAPFLESERCLAVIRRN